LLADHAADTGVGPPVGRAEGDSRVDAVVERAHVVDGLARPAVPGGAVGVASDHLVALAFEGFSGLAEVAVVVGEQENAHASTFPTAGGSGQGPRSRRLRLVAVAGDLGAEGPEALDRGGIDLWHLGGERGLDPLVGLVFEPTVLAGLEMGADLGREVVFDVAVEIALEDASHLAAVDLGLVSAASASADHVGRPFT
jgi:hypothetical protein